ncbi:MAG: ABC transporter substrate-binding protein [Peptoniphilaceae bacterium]|nr:ABC transporter substrate-binding protein [Peptoniphilaceae bacterium]MDY6086083.1 ABC transporter substrate-binding protein [Peptoniphilaceae bacterium]
MKGTKFAALGLALLMGLTACGTPASNNGAGDTSAAPEESQGAETSAAESGQAAEGTEGEQLVSDQKDVSISTNREVSTLDYVVTALTADHEINANLVDGLLENDHFGKLVPAIAESWESNEDRSVWTFKIRPGVKWVTNTGEEYGEVTAEDFVTGVRHGAEFESGTSWLLNGVLDGYADYLKSDFSDEAWSKVGVKALDDLTLEFTMQKDENGKPTPVPYFDSMTTYTVLYPISREFLEAQGPGCKLGAPDTENCAFGSKQPDSILYNGGFILTDNTEKSKAVLTKNAAYWDAEHVYVDSVTRIYDDGTDPYSTINGFENGIYFQAALSPSWENYDEYAKKYEGKTMYQVPNATVFGVVFNLNRQSFEYTNYATDQKMAENTHKALLNDNFRKALRAAYDAKAYLAVRMPDDLATESLRNVNNFPGAGTTSDGKMYYDLVTEAYNADTGENRNLNDGQVPFTNKEEALAFIEKAKEEGIEFPVHLDMMVNSQADILVKQSQSFKQSVEANTDSNIIIELVLETEDTINSVVYENQDPAKMDYDISTYTGWGPDYADPKSFVDIYSPTTGYYMASMGLGLTDDKGEVIDKEIKESVGLMEYEKLYREADAITDDLDARYKAFAKADAYLIERCLFIPGSMDSRANVVSKMVPFSRPFSDYGVSDLKYKGLRVQNDLVTSEEFQKVYDEFKANR